MNESQFKDPLSWLCSIILVSYKWGFYYKKNCHWIHWKYLGKTQFFNQEQKKMSLRSSGNFQDASQKDRLFPVYFQIQDLFLCNFNFRHWLIFRFICLYKTYYQIGLLLFFKFVRKIGIAAGTQLTITNIMVWVLQP